MLLAFCLRRCTEASEASVICTLEVRAPQANKKKTSTNKSRAKQAQAQAKDKCRRRQIQAPQAAKPNTRRFGAQKSTGQCGEKIEPCFCEGKLRGSTFGSLPKNEGVRLSPNPICADRAAFAAQSHRQAQLVLPAACCRRRASSARREGAARTFFGCGQVEGTKNTSTKQSSVCFSKLHVAQLLYKQRAVVNSPENRGVWRSEMALLRLRSCVAISSCWFARIKFSSCRNAQQVKG